MKRKNIKWAFSTNAFTNGRYTIFDAFEWLSRIGYNGVEILMDKPLLWPFDMKKQDIKKIREKLKNLGIKISGINAFTCSGYWIKKSKKPPGQKFGPCFCDYEREFRDMRTEYTKRVIDIANELGVKNVSTTSGYRPLRGTREESWENMIHTLKNVVRYARGKHVNINIEPEPGCLVGSAKEAIDVVKDVGFKNFGINFDIGHFFVSDRDVVNVIKLFEKEIPGKINGVHIEDIGLDKKNRPVHYHLIPGEGKMPLRKIIKTVLNTGYNGFFTIELYTYYKKPVYAARKSMEWINNLKI